MRKLFLLPLAGLLVIGGATAAVAAPSVVGDAARQVSSAMTKAGSFLSEVLDDLVADGVINQDQADAIVDAVDTRVEEKRAEKEATRELLRNLLEDGAITTDELAQLPADHPWRNIAGILDDGQITLDELRALSPFGGRGPRGFGPGGHGFGPGGGHGHWFQTPDSDTDGDTGTDPQSDS